jgi:hypothetical protein
MSIITDLMKHRTCKFCGDSDNNTWHRDRWGGYGKGYYCHLCYTSIRYIEDKIGDGGGGGGGGAGSSSSTTIIETVKGSDRKHHRDRTGKWDQKIREDGTIYRFRVK